MPKKWLAAAIDVGTTKICSCIAEIDDKEIRVIGTGCSPSTGLKKGVVVNLSETIRNVRSSLEIAEEDAGKAIESAWVSVGGRFIRSANLSARTEVRGKSNRVTEEDVGRAVAEAQQQEFPQDLEIIHVLTQGFGLDGQDDILDPVGMAGHSLSVKVHVVFNSGAVIQNIVNAINKAGVVVNGVVMQQLASAEAVLTPDEKELGTILVDVGGGTTDIALYDRGCIWHSEVLPMGGSLITKDIAIGLRSPLQEAERLKIETGNAFPDSAPDEEVVEISEIGTGRTQTYSRRLLCQIIEARCDEILRATDQVLKRAGVQSELVTGAVFTGGGSLLPGFVEKAREVLDRPVRLGYPLEIQPIDSESVHPAYATAVGLLKYARNVRQGGTAKITFAAQPFREKAASERLKNWIFEKIG